MNTDTPSTGPSGVERRSKRPVTSATQMITANAASVGAGSNSTTADSRNASATAHSYRRTARVSMASSAIPPAST